jgi:hypothetical protein
MSLINVAIDSSNITPASSDYLADNNHKVIHNKTIYCDISGSGITDNSFNLFLTLTSNENDIQKFNVLFRNNNNSPIITILSIDNISIPILLNNRDITNPASIMTNQEFILTSTVAGSYTAISTVRRYN